MPSPSLQRLKRELEKQRVSENREQLVWGAGMAEGTPQPPAPLGVDCLRSGCGWESCQSCPTLWTPRTTQSMEFSRTEIFCPLEVCLLNLFQARGGEGWAGEKGPGRWAGRWGKRLWAGRVSIIPVPKETQALGMWIPYCWALPLTCQMLHTKNIPESRLREMTLSPRGGCLGP